MFQIRSPQEVLFGWGSVEQIPGMAKRYGLKRPLLVVGGQSLSASGVLQKLREGLTVAVEAHVLFEGIGHDPAAGLVDTGRSVLQASGCDSVIAVGGGSVMDVGKAIAGLANEQLPAEDFVRGCEITARSLPVICATTTAGTGSEVTHVAVLTDPVNQLKVGIRTDSMMPVAAVVDPALTITVPPQQTAFTGLDAFVQAVEAFVSRGASVFSDALAFEAAVRIGTWLPVAYMMGDHHEARENLSLGSMMAGLALASARLGLVHGIAHPLGALYNLAHGQACALLMPAVIRFNAEVAAEKYARLARALRVSEAEDDYIATMDLAQWVAWLNIELEVQLSGNEFGLTAEDYPAIVDAALVSGSSKANPETVTADAIVSILDLL